MWRFSKFYDEYRDVIGTALIALGLIGAMALIIWLCFITSGWALVWIVIAGLGVLFVAALIGLARLIWEEFFE